MTRFPHMLLLAGLFLAGDAAGKTWRPMPSPPRPSAPLPAIKPDPAAVWNALAAEEARIAREIREESGR